MFEVVREAEAFFVPVDGVNQRLHGERGLVDKGRFGVEVEADFFALGVVMRRLTCARLPATSAKR